MVLKNRTVIVFPDSDVYNDWLEKSESIYKQINLNLVVSSFLLNCTIEIDQKKGYDLADLKQINMDLSMLIRVKESCMNINLALLIQRNSYLSELIRVFDLYIDQ